MTRVKVNVAGIVQGVGFRPFVYRTAVRYGLKGYVRNMGDAGVEILLEGKEADVRNFMRDLMERRPTLAQIHDVTITRLEGEDEHESFTIRESSDKVEFSGSIVPPDIAICDNCLSELRKLGDPRYDYFFITCTDCGPRFTVIERLPYDRRNTTMRDFLVCDFCRREYSDQSSRRFHAQTVACPRCGPKAYLTTRMGEPIKHDDPIREAGKLLSEGFIVAIKGYGGFHIAATTTMDEPLIRLRKVKHRRQKPFAIMARSLEVVRSFAYVSPKEAELLTSYARPIVLLTKSNDYYLSDLIAPKLHNIGVMLPYTGLHYMLFDDVDEPAFVMTSANLPNQPIVKDDEEALTTLGDVVDYFLFHNRRIANRCDDSVVRVHGEKAVFIRRSRGYAPSPVMLKVGVKRCALGLGGELNNTACILLRNKAFISQHIGDVENVETRDFLESTVRHLIHLTNSKVEVIACDLHPKFITTKLARDLAEGNRLKLIQVQHHHAHVAALMAEHGVNEIIGVCCDGYGYGVDGKAWGGEVLFCVNEPPSFKRVAHIEEQPLIGGDLATRYPLRMVAGILRNKVDIEGWLLQNKQYFPYGEREIQVIIRQLKRSDSAIKTTSCGRVLDAVSAVLGICYERTYEGEPAMKLESVAMVGKDALNMEPIIEGNTLNTTQMLLKIFESVERLPKADLAYSAHAYLAKGLATLAVEKALENGVEAVGFSGGVAYNWILTSIMRNIVEAAGLRFLTNETIPPGDGGISLGQAIISSLSF